MAEEKKRPSLHKLALNRKDFKRLNSFIYTGNASFDIAVSDGRGMPLGTFITLFAARATGKTTLCLDIAKRLLDTHKEKNEPYKIYYIDVEGSLDLVESMGLLEYCDSGDFLYNAALDVTFNQLEQLYRDILGGKVAELKDVKLVIIDSIGEITTQDFIDKKVEKGSYGPKQKACAELLGKIQGACLEKGLTTLLISHEKEDSAAGTVFTGPAKRESGGKAVGFSSSIILRLGKKVGEDKLYVKKIKYKTIHGDILVPKYYKVTFKSSEKNRYGRLGSEVEMLVEPGKRCVNSFIIHAILESNGLLKSRDRGNKGKGFILIDELLAPELRGVEMNAQELHKFISKHEKALIYDYLIPKGFFKYNIGGEIEDDEDNPFEETGTDDDE